MRKPDEFLADVVRLETLIFKDFWRTAPITEEELDKFSDGVLQLVAREKGESNGGKQPS